MSNNKPDGRRGSAEEAGPTFQHESLRAAAGVGLRLAVIIVTLIAVPLVLYLPVRHFSLLSWDDGANLTQNPLYRPLPSSHLRELWTKPYFSAYIPITRMVWADLANVRFSADGSPTVSFDPQTYHLANVAVHIANVLLVFLIVRLMLPKLTRAPGLTKSCSVSSVARPPQETRQADWAAAFGALVFAVHPLQVEAVAWITGMKDLLGAFFSFVALWLYLLFATSACDRPRWGLFAGSFAAFIMAMLSKSTTVILPLIAALLDCLITIAAAAGSERGGNEDENRAQPVSLWAAVRHRLIGLGIWMVASVPVVFAANYADHMYVVPVPTVAFWQRPFVAGDALAFYLGKFLLPVSLGADYSRTPAWLLRHSWSYVSILVPITLVAAAWRLRAKSVAPIAAVGIFVVGLLPASGLAAFTFETFSTVADRYAYFVMLGGALGIAALFASLPSRASAVAGLCLIAVLSVLTARQIPVWETNTSLFTHNLRVNPRSAVSYEYLGLAKEQAGDIDGAIDDYHAAARLNPKFTPALNDLARALTYKWQKSGAPPAKKGLLDEAQADLLEAIRLVPEFYQAHAGLGYLYAVEGHNQEAIGEYQVAIRYDPGNPQYYFLLSTLFVRVGDDGDGLSCMRKAADLGEPAARQFFERAQSTAP